MPRTMTAEQEAKICQSVMDVQTAFPEQEFWGEQLLAELDAERAAHSQTIQERDELHEAIHKTGTCPIAGCKGVDDYKQKIFTHKHLDIECIEKGCQSLFLDELRSQLAETIQAAEKLAEALNEAGGVVKLMDQIGLQWKHNDGSTITLEGTKECLAKCKAALAQYAALRSGK